MEILPSEEYWRRIGFEDPRKIIGNINGPKSRQGLSGWSRSELNKVLTYCDENESYFETLTRKALLGVIQRKAVKTVRLLTLLTEYCKKFPILPIRKIARSADIDHEGVTKKSLVLSMFLHNNDLLVTAYYLSLTAGRQTVYTYATDLGLNKATITSETYKSALENSLKTAPSLMDKKLKIDHMVTKRQDPVVLFYIKHERDRVYMPLMKEENSHWDVPARITTISINTKGQGLEVKTSMRKALTDIVSAVSETLLGDKNAFYPLSQRGELSKKTRPIDTSITLESQILKSVEAEGVGLIGTPNIRIRGVDIYTTVEYLRKHKEIDLTRNIVGWEVQLSLKQKGVVTEFKVIKSGAKIGDLTGITFEPKSVPYELKEYVYTLYSNGKIPELP